MLFSRNFFAALLAVAAVSVQAQPDWSKGYDIGVVYCGHAECTDAAIYFNICHPFGPKYNGQVDSFKLDRCDSHCLLYQLVKFYLPIPLLFLEGFFYSSLSRLCYRGYNCTGISDRVDHPGRHDVATFSDLTYWFKCEQNAITVRKSTP